MTSTSSLSRQGSVHSLSSLENDSPGPGSSGTSVTIDLANGIAAAAPTLPGTHLVAPLQQRLADVFTSNGGSWPQDLITFLESETNLSQKEIIEVISFIKEQPAVSLTTNAVSSPDQPSEHSVGKVTDALKTEKGDFQIKACTKVAVNKADDGQRGVGDESPEKKANRAGVNGAHSAAAFRSNANQSHALDSIQSVFVRQLDKQRAALNELESKVSALSAQLPVDDMRELKSALHRIKTTTDDLENTTRLAAPENTSPVFDLKVMGDRATKGQADGEKLGGSAREFDATFLDVLKGSSVGSGNHGLERAGWIRTELNGLLDQVKFTTWGRGSGRLGSLFVGPSRELEIEIRKSLMNLFQTNDVQGGRNVGSLNISRMAAMNLVAAGYNPKTMERDAPSLAYKAENVGFSTLTKVMCAASRAGKTTREPAKHISHRLETLATIQVALQNTLFPEGQHVEVNHLLKTNSCLTEFGALILASVPQDFLILNPELVLKTKELTERCKAEETESDHFQQNKSDFEKLYAEVRVALDAHGRISQPDRKELVAMSDRMVIEVHRRGYIKKAVSSIARGFMRNIGAPLGGMKRAVGEFWEVASAGVRFKAKMADSRDKFPIPSLLLALEKTEKLTKDEKALFKNFLSGKTETLNLRNVDAACLSPSQWNAFKAHVDKTWEFAAPGVPKPTNLVSYPNGLPAEFYLPPGVVLDSAEKKDGSGLSIAGATLTKTRSAPVSANATNRVMAKVSGEGNRCWLRAANAAALEYAGVDAVSERVLKKLEGFQEKWRNPEKNKKFVEVVPDDYEYYMPENQEELAELYTALESARDEGYRLADDKEAKLQKITLQLALSELDSNTQIKDKSKEDDLWRNVSDLFRFQEKQGDASIVVGFLVKSLGIPIFLGTNRDPVATSYEPEALSNSLLPRELDQSGKRADRPLIYHEGHINSGHFEFAINTTEPKPAQ